MPTLRHALSLALLLSACTTHDDGGKPGGATPVKPESTKPEAVKPDPAAPAVTVAVASVQLIQDCPDPPEAAAEAASAVPEPAPAAQQAPMPAAGASLKMKMGERADPSAWSPPCTQSTLQLALRNPGKADATLRVEAVRLVDAGSKQVLGPIAVRKPGVWNPEGRYQPWDERVAVGADLKISYRLADPDWSQVTTALGPDVNLYARPFVLEVDVAIDGTRQTVRSPEFVREQVHMIAT